VAADAASQVVISGDDVTDEAEAVEAVEESASTEEAPYGDGSHAPLDDGAQPEGFPIKGNEDSKFYYTPGSEAYDGAAAEVWFATAEDAEAAGFSVPPAQEESADEDTNA
jgi:large subunit ribosomal protein L17